MPLREGRDYGSAFSLGYAKGDKIFLLSPLSPCKDYLSDVCFTEHTGKPCSAHGLELRNSQSGGFKGGAYLCVSSLNYQNGYPYGKKAEQQKTLSEKKEKLAESIDIWSAEMNIEGKCKYEFEAKYLNEPVFVFSIPREWTMSGPHISMLTTLIRVCIEVPEMIGKKINDIKQCQKSNDFGKFAAFQPMLEWAAKNKAPKAYDFMGLSDSATNGTIHNWGFFAFYNLKRRNENQEEP